MRLLKPRLHISALNNASLTHPCTDTLRVRLKGYVILKIKVAHFFVAHSVYRYCTCGLKKCWFRNAFDCYVLP